MLPGTMPLKSKRKKEKGATINRLADIIITVRQSGPASLLRRACLDSNTGPGHQFQFDFSLPVEMTLAHWCIMEEEREAREGCVTNMHRQPDNARMIDFKKNDATAPVSRTYPE